MAIVAISPLKFVGTISLGLLTGVSYAVSRFALPSLLKLSSSDAATGCLTHLVASLRVPLMALSYLAAVPLTLAFVLAPRHGRHPYLIYAAGLAACSQVVPRFLGAQLHGRGCADRRPTAKKSTSTPAAARARMEASYEVLGDDTHSEPTSEEDVEDAVNGEDVRVAVQGLSRGYAAQAGLAALGFVFSVVGLWGDGAPTIIIANNR